VGGRHAGSTVDAPNRDIASPVLEPDAVDAREVRAEVGAVDAAQRIPEPPTVADSPTRCSCAGAARSPAPRSRRPGREVA
jgi:hypothetical protein